MCHTVDMEFHYTSLQCDRTWFYAFVFAMLPGIHCGVYTFKYCTMKANPVCHHADIHSSYSQVQDEGQVSRAGIITAVSHAEV